MNDPKAKEDAESLRVQLAALEQLLEVYEQAALEQSNRLERALLELRESARFFESVLAAASDAIVTVDERQQVLLFNRQAEAIFGYRAPEMIGKPLDCLIPARFRAAHRSHVAKFAAEPVARRDMGERPELRGLRKNGEEFPIEATLSKLELDGRRLFTAIVRDVTERKRLEAALGQRLLELEQFKAVTIERENRMIELKEEVNRLSRQLGRPEPYDVTFEAERQFV